MPKPRFITCPKCGAVNVKHFAKGLCKTCYGRQKKRPRHFGICIQCDRTLMMMRKTICDNCAAKEWKNRHPEWKKKHAEREKKWRAEHPEENRERESRRTKTPKRIAWAKEHNKKYYQEHREELCAYQSQWRRTNPERRDHYKKRRRARVLNLLDTLTLEEWNAILERFNHSCVYCQRTDQELVKDHLIPAVMGGGFTAENIVPACTSCNCSKSDTPVEEFIALGKAKSLHPLLLAQLPLAQKTVQQELAIQSVALPTNTES